MHEYFKTIPELVLVQLAEFLYNETSINICVSYM